MKEREIAEYVKRWKTGPAFKQAEADLAFQAVILIGPMAAKPRRIGDNRGAWDLRVVVTANPDSYIKTHQSHHGDQRQIIGETWTLSYAHATRLQDHLQTMLYGDGESAERLLGQWLGVELDDPREVWDTLLAEAVKAINATESIEVFGRREKDERIALHAKTRPPHLRRVK